MHPIAHAAAALLGSPARRAGSRAANGPRATLLHGDLWTGNVLVDGA